MKADTGLCFYVPDQCLAADKTLTKTRKRKSKEYLFICFRSRQETHFHGGGGGHQPRSCLQRVKCNFGNV